MSSTAPSATSPAEPSAMLSAAPPAASPAQSPAPSATSPIPFDPEYEYVKVVTNFGRISYFVPDDEVPGGLREMVELCGPVGHWISYDATDAERMTCDDRDNCAVCNMRTGTQLPASREQVVVQAGIIDTMEEEAEHDQ